MNLKKLFDLLYKHGISFSELSSQLKYSENVLIEKMSRDDLTNKDIERLSYVLNLSDQEIINIFFEDFVS